LRLLFIGDIVGRPGREMIKEYLHRLKEEYNVDFVIANYENASHGFGLTSKNAKELFGYGIDCMTGGNHTWDKKEITPLLESEAILRPLNYPQGVVGKGIEVFNVAGEKLAVINIMGHYGMPMCENPFLTAQKVVQELQEQNIKNIFIDLHAEASAEKRGMMMLLEGKVSAIVGTHTHIGSDDLQISRGTMYLSDVGLSGCRDNVIGMDKKAPLNQFLTGIKGHFDIPKKCKRILQCVVFELKEGITQSAQKIRVFDDGQILSQNAFIEV